MAGCIFTIGNSLYCFNGEKCFMKAWIKENGQIVICLAVIAYVIYLMMKGMWP